MTKKKTNKKEFKIFLVSSDGKSIDAQVFRKESRVVDEGYEFENVISSKIDIESGILYKVRDFCVGRAKIRNDPANNDQNLVQQKLNDFNSKFLQDNQTQAIDLMLAACKLEIKSLLDLMMKDAVGMLTQKTTDEIYDIFFVNLKEYNASDFEAMVVCLYSSGWAFK